MCVTLLLKQLMRGCGRIVTAIIMLQLEAIVMENGK